MIILKNKNHNNRHQDQQGLLQLQKLINLQMNHQDLLDHLSIETKLQIKHVQLLEEKNQNNKIDLEASKSTAAQDLNKIKIVNQGDQLTVKQPK